MDAFPHANSSSDTAAYSVPLFAVEGNNALPGTSDALRLSKLVRRVDELEVVLARIHRVCAVQLGIHPRGRRNRSGQPFRSFDMALRSGNRMRKGGAARREESPVRRPRFARTRPPMR